MNRCPIIPYTINYPSIDVIGNNTGSGAEVYSDFIDNPNRTLKFRTLIGDDIISFTQDTDTISAHIDTEGFTDLIDGVNVSDEKDTLYSIFKNITTVDNVKTFNFRRLKSAENIKLSEDTATITIDINLIQSIPVTLTSTLLTQSKLVISPINNITYNISGYDNIYIYITSIEIIRLESSNSGIKNIEIKYNNNTLYEYNGEYRNRLINNIPYVALQLNGISIVSTFTENYGITFNGSFINSAIDISDDLTEFKLTTLTLNEKLISHKPKNVININDNIKI